MVNCILGKSKTGKTTHIYNEIKDNLDSGKKVILFVPSQARAKAEEEYMKILGVSGIIGVNVTTISEFIAEETKLFNLHVDENFLSKLDRKIILTQVIKENPELFNVFKKVKNYPGFLDILDIYMDLFRKSGLDFKNLEVSTGDKRTDSKFEEIKNVYNKYFEKMSSKYTDAKDEMDMFLSNISKSSWFEDVSSLNVYFDGYNNFSNSEYELIDKIIKMGVNVTFVLNTDIAKIEDIYVSDSIFETVNKTYKRICAICAKNDVALDNIVKYDNVFSQAEDIKYIANNLFSNEEEKREKISLPSFEFKIHTNIAKEVEAVAKEIATLVKKGYRYSDFAIYTTCPEEYETLISRTFYANNLEIYLAKSKPVSDSILAKYIQGLLNLACYGLNLELVFDLLKQGLTDIDLKDVYMLENYMKEFNVNKYLVENSFTLNNLKQTYDLDELNSLKAQVVSMYDFVKTIKNGSAKDIISAIYSHLVDNNIFNNYDNLVSIVEEEDTKNFESQIWNSISTIFDSISKVYADEELTIEEFTSIFNLVIKDIKVKTIPATKDRIELVDINVTKTLPKKIGFFIGVTEGKFPKKVDEDILFRDSELEKLKDKNIDIRETTISKLNMGFFNIYETLNNISEKLYVYIPSAEISGKATRKSSLLTLMSQIANFEVLGDVTGNSEVKDIFSLHSKDELFMWLIKSIYNMKDGDDISLILNVYKYFSEDPVYKDILTYKKNDSNLSSEITDIIYRDEFKTSVSRLELYKKCPFSYFMQYILKVLPNQEAKLNVLELGSFMHGVLEVFSKKIMEKGISWQAILDETQEEILPEYEKVLEEIIYDSIDKNLSKQKQSVKYMVLKRKLINTMKKVIRTVALSYNQSEFKPYDYEIEFKDGSAFLPMEIDLGDGKVMKLIGKIDRVDFLNFRDSMYIRVVDYKSSGKDLKIDKIKEGLSLQLITYMMAFMDNVEKNENIKVNPAAMVYFNLSDRLVSLSEYYTDNEKIKAEIMKRLKMNGLFLSDIELLTKMDRHFEDSKSSLIDVTKQSITKGSSKVIEEEAFKNLCDETRVLLKEIGKEIASGNVKIAPNKKENYCKYCKYSSTCRKNINV